MKKIILIAVIAVAALVSNAQSLKPLYKDLPVDSLTGLTQKYLVTNFCLTYGVNPATGVMDTTQQQIVVSYVLIKYDKYGNPYTVSKIYRKAIRQGTEEFNTWFNSFEQFGVMMKSTVDSLTYPIE